MVWRGLDAHGGLARKDLVAKLLCVLFHQLFVLVLFEFLADAIRHVDLLTADFFIRTDLKGVIVDVVFDD